jgi:heme-degrading monooxygenase HmoA
MLFCWILSSGTAQMTILREWRAEIRRELCKEYVEYVQATGIAAYRESSGNLGATIATRDLDETRSEIVVLSWWTNRDAIREFAGDAIDIARYFPKDDAYLLTRPNFVQHYESEAPR